MDRKLFHAVLLDLDGTLYWQTPLRCLMAMELGALPLSNLSLNQTQMTLGILRKFRKIREQLRMRNLVKGQQLEDLQYEETASQVRVSANEVKAVVSEWMYRRPLKYLQVCRQRGVVEFFSSMVAQGVQIGIFSDYPVQEKIEALGLSKWVKLRLCATDKEVNAFKPHPQGFWRACELWGLSPAEVLYVGDRVEVDGVGAKAAGMPCIILDGTNNAYSSIQSVKGPVRVTSFQGIQDALTILS